MKELLRLENALLQGAERPLLEIPELMVFPGTQLHIRRDNGSGKTMLLKVLAGLQPLDAGKRTARFTRFALILENPDDQFLFSSVRRELLFPLENRRLSVREMERELRRVVEYFALESLLDRIPFQLSGGQKQLLLFAVAALSQPEIYFCDGLDHFLDSPSTERVAAFLEQERRRGRAVVDTSVESGPPGKGEVLVLREGKPVVPAPGLPGSSTGREKRGISKTSAAKKGSGILLQVAGLTFGWPRQPLLFEDYSLSLQAGAVTWLRGAVGAGKSTLALLLSGLLAPRAGTIRLAGKQLVYKRASSFFAQGVAYAFQYPESQFAFPILQEELNWLYPDPGFQKRFQDLLRQLGIPVERESVRPLRRWSRGWKRLAALALVLAAEKPLFILDEPFLGLDEEGETALKEMLSRLKRQGMALLIIDHRHCAGWQAVDAVIDLDAQVPG